MGVSTPGSDDEPTHQARVTIEKRSELKVDVVAPRQTLQMVACMLVAIGATAGPVLTFTAVPVGYPVWATTSASIGQLAVLALVVSIVRGVNKPGRALR